MFEYFPSNYPWSLTVAVSIGMGGEMSEIAEACRPLENVATGASNAVATEAWYQSWRVLGQKLQGQAKTLAERGWGLTAGRRYFRACNYYLMAERNMAWSDPRRLSCYRDALDCFEKGYTFSGHRCERVDVEGATGTLSGYLRLPDGDGPFPVVIFFNGFDSIKEMHYLLYAQDAVDRGLAVLFIDQEGTGEAMRLHDIKKIVESERSTAPFIEFLEKHPAIDSDRIAVGGISNGGYDAPRAAAFEKRLKAVGALGAFYNAEDYMGRFDGTGEGNVTKGLSDLDDHMMKVTGKDTPEAAFRFFALRDLNNVVDKITIPLLVVHGENDRQVPIWHADRLVKEAINSPRVDYKVFSLSEGSCEHCGVDITSMHSEYFFDWFAEVLGGTTSA